MPVEIRELVIRAVTTMEEDELQDVAAAEAVVDEREIIIQECVRQILRILQKSKER